MKIHLAFLCPYNNSWIGWWDRKYGIYYRNLNQELFEGYMIYITQDSGVIKTSWNEIILTEDKLDSFLREKKIEFVYFGWAKISQETEDTILKYTTGLVNVNFTPIYTTDKRKLNLIISMTDYWKLRWIHGELSNSYVVYNPVDVELWREERKKVTGKYRKLFQWKKYIIGRIARTEPSKWHWLILATLQKLDREKNYQYGFLFAGMPWLYRKYIHFFFSREMQTCIVMIPEQRKYEDIAGFYASIDIFWQTSWIGESFGNVIAEAACFSVPTITDYKGFYRNGIINPELYDAQIELVNHAETWIYATSPDAIIHFLNTLTHERRDTLGKNAETKVEQEYHIKYTSLTLAKILYEYGRKNLGTEYDEAMERLSQLPSNEVIDSYEKEYQKRVALWFAFDNIQSNKIPPYITQEKLWRIVEYGYLFIRKILKNYFNKNIEFF